MSLVMNESKLNLRLSLVRSGIGIHSNVYRFSHSNAESFPRVLDLI